MIVKAQSRIEIIFYFRICCKIMQTKLSQLKMANLIELELWRVFSFYSLHSDPTMPEQLKVPSFIRFAKDSQIISPKLKGAIIELEIARVVSGMVTKMIFFKFIHSDFEQARGRRVQDGGEYNPSTSLSFLEFLDLLGLLSQKVSMIV